MDASSKPIDAIIPEEDIVETFGGILSASPLLWDSLICDFAAKYGRDVEETNERVQNVLASQPPYAD